MNALIKASALVCTFILTANCQAQAGDDYPLANPNALGKATIGWDDASAKPAIVFSNRDDFLNSITWEESNWQEDFPFGLSAMHAYVDDDAHLRLEKFTYDPIENCYTFETAIHASIFATVNSQSGASFVVFGGNDDWFPSLTLPTGELTMLGAKIFVTIHYEIRDIFNNPKPPVVSVPATTPGWTELPPGQSVFHDNGVGLPERKFIHEDGREVVYDGDTGVIITDPDLGGTFNYINPAPAPDCWYDVTGWGVFVGRGGGHVLVDVIPYLGLGNDRPPVLGF